MAKLEAERIKLLGEALPHEYYRGFSDGRAEMAAANERLRAKIDELLPWASYGLGWQGDCRCVVVPGSTCLNGDDPLAVEAHDLLARIFAGEFREVT